MFARDAGIAQLVEQLICNQQVGGSSPSTSSINKRRQPRGWNGSDTISYGGIPEWPKGADCKSVVTDFGGSNPPSPTRKKRRPLDVSFSCVWAFGRWIRKAALGDSPVDCRNRRGFSAEKRIHRRMRNKETAFGGFFVWYGHLEGGFERRHLAAVRTVATAVAFPQKSESTFPHQNRIAILTVAILLLFCYHFKKDYDRRRAHGLWCN